ncbi:MAG: hypothetical protein QMB03_12565 [Spirosomataceae bacterium]
MPKGETITPNLIVPSFARALYENSPKVRKAIDPCETPTPTVGMRLGSFKFDEVGA